MTKITFEELLTALNDETIQIEDITFDSSGLMVNYHAIEGYTVQCRPKDRRDCGGVWTNLIKPYTPREERDLCEHFIRGNMEDFPKKNMRVIPEIAEKRSHIDLIVNIKAEAI